MNRLCEGPGGIYELRAKIDDLKEENQREAEIRSKQEDELNTTRREKSEILNYSEAKIADIEAELFRTTEENNDLKRKAEENKQLKVQVDKLRSNAELNHKAENQRFSFGLEKEELTEKSKSLEAQLEDERVKVAQLEQDLIIGDAHRQRIEELLKEKTAQSERLNA